MPLHDVSLVEGGLSALSVPLCLKAHFCQAEIYNLRGHVSKNGKADSILTKRRGPAVTFRRRQHEISKVDRTVFSDVGVASENGK
ncbi:hypothetical protein HCH47_28230 [Klebsiella variicola]|nr:hypothetical protein [Klebsiella variicola]MBX8887760.1 hypothetical protein [Klebsiella variicola]